MGTAYVAAGLQPCGNPAVRGGLKPAAYVLLWCAVALAHTGQAAAQPDAVVAADGTGQYRTLQAAIDAVAKAPASKRSWLIAIRPGTYRELVHIPRGLRPLALVGDDPTRTTITYNQTSATVGADGQAIGTFRSATMFVEGDDVSIENLTIQNDAGPVGQAVALRIDGDRVVVRNSRLLGWQDTLLLNRGRQYIEDSYIAGHVDFIFGAATAFFSRCHVHAWRDGYLTAASTPADAPHGFVFADGIVTGEPEVRTYLGRPWRDFAQTTFLRTVMGAAVVPEGWNNWSQPAREKTARYAEFGSSGPGALALERRAGWSRKLTQAEAARITVAAVLGGTDKWNPLAVPKHPGAALANTAPLPVAPGPAETIKAWQTNAVTWDRVLVQPAAWYGSAEAIAIAANVLRYQRHTGGWPKNIDMARPLDIAERTQLAADSKLSDSTIDNDATVTQLRLLARVHAATKPTSGVGFAKIVKPTPDVGFSDFMDSLVRGLRYLLSAQYANGGWPQYFPLRKDYSRHVTFNDNAMIGVMTLLDEASSGRAPFDFVDPAMRAEAAGAVARGHKAVLQTQIRVNGRLTGWCQQYDAVTLMPAGARTYEHPSISGMETAAILIYLLRVDKPDAPTIAAIEGAMAWLVASQVKGVRIEQRPDPAGPSGFDVVAVPDAGAPPVWARFYDIQTNRPIFSGRDSVIKATLAEIEIERRTGYNWYGTWPRELVETLYPAWKVRLKR